MPTIEWLIRAGDQLAKKGTRIFKAGESLKAGSTGALNFKLLEGESDDPSDDRFIGRLFFRRKGFFLPSKNIIYNVHGNGRFK